MADGGSLFIPGRVEFIEGSGTNSFIEDYGALRIKVRIDSDGNKSINDLPWAFPAIPKPVHVMPKVGEGVWVLNSTINKPDSQRYYIGPIISQPQFENFCPFDGDFKLGIDTQSRGPAMSLLSTKKPTTVDPLASINRKKELTDGAFPRNDDVALVGRGQEDVVLKYGNKGSGTESEVDLRAGIRLMATDDTIPYLRGNVLFNTKNPAYLQVKYSTNGLSGIRDGIGDSDENKYESTDLRTANGVVNVVADKINLISHQDSSGFGEKITDRNNLIKDGELDEIMSQLHRCVYGDELIILLKKIITVLAMHTHPHNQLIPTWEGTDMADLVAYPFEKIISPNVRIS